MGFLGHALVEDGQVERGLGLLEEARYARLGLGLFKSLVGMQLANAYLRAGPGCARRLEDLEAAQEQGPRPTGLVLGRIAQRAEEGDKGDARECFENALARAEALGMTPLAAQCHFALGRRGRKPTRTSRSREMPPSRPLPAGIDGSVRTQSPPPPVLANESQKFHEALGTGLISINERPPCRCSSAPRRCGRGARSLQVDGSSQCDRVVRQAGELAALCDARLVLAYVADPGAANDDLDALAKTEHLEPQGRTQACPGTMPSAKSAARSRCAR